MTTLNGFANAQGGKIYIGKNDEGVIVGLDNYEELMDAIPNKVISALGILIDINLIHQGKKYCIEIIVPKSSVAISLRGRFYYRSGSTKQELTGTALNEFLLKKAGQSWDDVTETRATINDIDENSVKKYIRDAEKTNRLPEEDGVSTIGFLEKLRLTNNSALKRAAIILFGKDTKKFYPNAYLKIGRFKSESELISQEVIEGNLFEIINNTLATLNNKFLLRLVEIEGIQRVEKYEYPLIALREVLLNALVHRRYTEAPVQVKIYDDKITIWNDGFLPDGLSIKDLYKPHSSRPRNPIIAEACFKGGYIESWGSGIFRILDACKREKLPAPIIEENSGGLLFTVRKKVQEESYAELGLNKRQAWLIALLQGEQKEITHKEYQAQFNVSRRTATTDLKNLMDMGLIEISSGGGNSAQYYKLTQ
jgi:ATP-dependent DNA helicase RecG